MGAWDEYLKMGAGGAGNETPTPVPRTPAANPADPWAAFLSATPTVHPKTQPTESPEDRKKRLLDELASLPSPGTNERNDPKARVNVVFGALRSLGISDPWAEVRALKNLPPAAPGVSDTAADMPSIWTGAGADRYGAGAGYQNLPAIDLKKRVMRETATALAELPDGPAKQQQQYAMAQEGYDPQTGERVINSAARAALRKKYPAYVEPKSTLPKETQRLAATQKNVSRVTKGVDVARERQFWLDAFASADRAGDINAREMAREVLRTQYSVFPTGEKMYDPDNPLYTSKLVMDVDKRKAYEARMKAYEEDTAAANKTIERTSKTMADVEVGTSALTLGLWNPNPASWTRDPAIQAYYGISDEDRNTLEAAIVEAVATLPTILVGGGALNAAKAASLEAKLARGLIQAGKVTSRSVEREIAAAAARGIELTVADATEAVARRLAQRAIAIGQGAVKGGAKSGEAVARGAAGVREGLAVEAAGEALTGAGRTVQTGQAVARGGQLAARASTVGRAATSAVEHARTAAELSSLMAGARLAGGALRGEEMPSPGELAKEFGLQTAALALPLAGQGATKSLLYTALRNAPEAISRIASAGTEMAAGMGISYLARGGWDPRDQAIQVAFGLLGMADKNPLRGNTERPFGPRADYMNTAREIKRVSLNSLNPDEYRAVASRALAVADALPSSEAAAKQDMLDAYAALLDAANRYTTDPRLMLDTVNEVRTRHSLEALAPTPELVEALRDEPDVSEASPSAAVAVESEPVRATQAEALPEAPQVASRDISLDAVGGAQPPVAQPVDVPAVASRGARQARPMAKTAPEAPQLAEVLAEAETPMREANAPLRASGEEVGAPGTSDGDPAQPLAALGDVYDPQTQDLSSGTVVRVEKGERPKRAERLGTARAGEAMTVARTDGPWVHGYTTRNGKVVEVSANAMLRRVIVESIPEVVGGDGQRGAEAEAVPAETQQQAQAREVAPGDQRVFIGENVVVRVGDRELRGLVQEQPDAMLAREGVLRVKTEDGETRNVLPSAVRAETAPDAAGRAQAAPVVEMPAAPAETPVARSGGPETARGGEGATGRRLRLRTPGGAQADAEWALVDAAELVPSHVVMQSQEGTSVSENPSYGKLGGQARGGRENVASVQQAIDMIRDFAPEDIANPLSTRANESGPTILPDNRTVAGNLRGAVLKWMYENAATNPRAKAMMEAYQSFLRENSQAAGIDGAQLDAMAQPVLVRRITESLTPDKARQFNIDSDTQANLGKTPIELARADAERLTDDVLARYEPVVGDITVYNNGRFISAWMEKMPVSEKGTLITEVDGRQVLNTQAQDRLRRAMFLRAYGTDIEDAQRMLSRLAELEEGNQIEKALLDAAPRVARLRALLRDAGADYDIGGDLIAAARAYEVARANGMNIGEVLAGTGVQRALEGTNVGLEGLSEKARALLSFFDREARSRQALGKGLNAYLEQAEGQVVRSGRLDLDTGPASPAIDMLRTALRQSREGLTLNQWTAQVRQSFPDYTQREVAAAEALVRAAARAQGLSADDYVARYLAGVEQGDAARFNESALQGNKGAVEFLNDGRAVIYALTKPDASTLVHELGHVFSRHLTGQAKTDVERWLGAREGAEWTREQQEQFARGFERYLAEGVAPTEGLKKVFAQFKQWLADIYRGITGSKIDVDIPVEVQRAFDRLLAKPEELGGVAREPILRAGEGARQVEAMPQGETSEASLLDELRRLAEGDGETGGGREPGTLFQDSGDLFAPAGNGREAAMRQTWYQLASKAPDGADFETWFAETMGKLGVGPESANAATLKRAALWAWKANARDATPEEFVYKFTDEAGKRSGRTQMNSAQWDAEVAALTDAMMGTDAHEAAVRRSRQFDKLTKEQREQMADELLPQVLEDPATAQAILRDGDFSLDDIVRLELARRVKTGAGRALHEAMLDTSAEGQKRYGFLMDVYQQMDARIWGAFSKAGRMLRMARDHAGSTGVDDTRKLIDSAWRATPEQVEVASRQGTPARQSPPSPRAPRPNKVPSLTFEDVGDGASRTRYVKDVPDNISVDDIFGVMDKDFADLGFLFQGNEDVLTAQERLGARMIQAAKRWAKENPSGTRQQFVDLVVGRFNEKARPFAETAWGKMEEELAHRRVAADLRAAKTAKPKTAPTITSGRAPGVSPMLTPYGKDVPTGRMFPGEQVGGSARPLAETTPVGRRTATAPTTDAGPLRPVGEQQTAPGMGLSTGRRGVEPTLDAGPVPPVGDQGIVPGMTRSTGLRGVEGTIDAGPLPMVGEQQTAPGMGASTGTRPVEPTVADASQPVPRVGEQHSLNTPDEQFTAQAHDAMLKARRDAGVEEPLTPEEKAMFADAVRTGDLVRVARAVHRLTPESIGRKLERYWIGNLLTGPATHARNVTGNATRGVMDLMTRNLAALYDIPLSRVRARYSLRREKAIASLLEEARAGRETEGAFSLPKDYQPSEKMIQQRMKRMQVTDNEAQARALEEREYWGPEQEGLGVRLFMDGVLGGFRWAKMAGSSQSGMGWETAKRLAQTGIVPQDLQSLHEYPHREWTIGRTREEYLRQEAERRARRRAGASWESLDDAQRVEATTDELGRVMGDARAVADAERAERVGGWANAAVNYSTRMLSVEDALMRFGAHRAELGRQGYRAARADAQRNGEVWANLSKAERERRVMAYVEAPTEAMEEAALKAGDRSVFMEENIGADFMQRVSNLASVYGFRPANLVIPFKKVPSNIVKSALIEYGPLGLLRMLPWQQMGAKVEPLPMRRKLAEELAQQTIGAVIWGTAMLLANQGLITGGYPSGKNEQERWRAAGRIPYAVKVGDKWYSYNFLPNIGGLLAEAGTFFSPDAKRKPVPERLRNMLVDVGLGYPLDLSMVRGMGDLYDAIKDGYGWERVVSGYAQGFVPGVGLLRSVQRATDTKQRQAETVGERLVAGLPGFSTMLPERRSAVGTALPRRSPWGAITPGFSSAEKPSDAVVQEALRIGLALPGAAKDTLKFNNKEVALTRNERREYQRDLEDATRDALQMVMGGSGYADESPDVQRKMLERAMDRYRNMVRTSWKMRKGLIEE